MLLPPALMIEAPAPEPGRVEYLKAFQCLGQVWQGKADPSEALGLFMAAADKGSIRSIRCLQEGCLSTWIPPLPEDRDMEAWYRWAIGAARPRLEETWRKGGWRQVAPRIVERIDGTPMNVKGEVRPESAIQPEVKPGPGGFVGGPSNPRR